MASARASPVPGTVRARQTSTDSVASTSSAAPGPSPGKAPRSQPLPPPPPPILTTQQTSASASAFSPLPGGSSLTSPTGGSKPLPLLEPFASQAIALIAALADVGINATLGKIRRSAGSAVWLHRCGDRAELKVDYGGSTLTWDVIWDARRLADPPDFVFDGADADAYDLRDMPACGTAWSAAASGDDFVAAVASLLVAFRNTQVARLQSMECGFPDFLVGVRSDVASVQHIPGLELLIVDRGSRARVQLVLPMYDLDAAQSGTSEPAGPPCVTDGHRFQLVFRYNVGKAIRKVELQCPPGYKLSAQVEVPTGPSIAVALFATVETDIRCQWHARRSLITRLQPLCGVQLDVDAVDWSRFSSLWADNSIKSVITVTLSAKFPKVCPDIGVQTADDIRGAAGSVVLQGDYPYDAAWDADIMAKRLWDVINAQIQRHIRSIRP